VMRIEKLKADIRGSKVLGPLMKGPARILDHVRAPSRDYKAGFPGSWTRGG